MKVLVADNLDKTGIRMIEEEQEIEVDIKTGLPPEDLKQIIGNYEALIIRSATKVTDEILQPAKRLKVIGRAGIGLDNVDLKAATKRGIVVMNTPGGNIVTTAEHTIAMMMALTRNIPQGTISLKANRWDKKNLQGREIFNKTLGIIGYGKIGSIVADLARGLKMNVIIYDPYITAEQIEKAGFEVTTCDELYRRSDYITVHVPKLKSTLGLLNKKSFDKMKKGVMVINCARGGIVNESDLYDAIVSGRVAGAALDVFETEPPGRSPLFELDRVICTPHLGASTFEAQTNVSVEVADQIIKYLKNGTIINAVNVPSIAGELLQRLGPYLSLADRIGTLQSQLFCGALKEVAIECNGDFFGLDMSSATTAVLKGLLAPIVKDHVNSVNAPILAKERGIKVTETNCLEAEDYINLITVKVIATETEFSVSGTIFGKSEPRIVKINNFRLEMIPDGHLTFIYKTSRPEAIGHIGTTLGMHDIAITQMQVGQDDNGESSIIYLRTDSPIPEEILDELRSLPSVSTAIALEI
ncbi:MAG: phosphoglycerate dehydrogenase [Desulfobacterales bacterium]